MDQLEEGIYVTSVAPINHLGVILAAVTGNFSLQRPDVSFNVSINTINDPPVITVILDRTMSIQQPDEMSCEITLVGATPDEVDCREMVFSEFIVERNTTYYMSFDVQNIVGRINDTQPIDVPIEETQLITTIVPTTVTSLVTMTKTVSTLIPTPTIPQAARLGINVGFPVLSILSVSYTHLTLPTKA